MVKACRKGELRISGKCRRTNCRENEMMSHTGKCKRRSLYHGPLTEKESAGSPARRVRKPRRKSTKKTKAKSKKAKSKKAKSKKAKKSKKSKKGKKKSKK